MRLVTHGRFKVPWSRALDRLPIGLAHLFPAMKATSASAILGSEVVRVDLQMGIPQGGAFDSGSVFIRPQEWTDVLARSYRISPKQAGQLLRAAADESAASGEARDLLGIWDRACRACDRYIVRREFAVGIMLGYYRWRTRQDGSDELVPTALAQTAGLERISDDIDAAIDAAFDSETEIEMEPDGWADA